jgi:hypothetical protein
MCAGLAVDSIETKVATLNGLALVYERRYEISVEFSLGVMEIVVMLLYEGSGDLYRSVVGFAKKFTMALEKCK